VLTEPDEDANVVGWLRVGSRIRVADDSRRGSGC